MCVQYSDADNIIMIYQLSCISMLLNAQATEMQSVYVILYIIIIDMCIVYKKWFFKNKNGESWFIVLSVLEQDSIPIIIIFNL